MAAWLPSLQKRYLEEHRAEVEHLGPNLEGTEIGLVVPEYVPINSIAELNAHAPKFDNKIIGIDPYAGIMGKTAAVIDAYGLSAFELVSGSGPTMTTALGNAIDQQRWIVVTGWRPHWKFAEWDLTYLDDPKKIYGRKEHIATIVRKKLKQDMPEVYAFFDNFYWHPGDLAEVKLMARDENISYPEAAKKWVANHPELVAQWIK
ncbi:MAG: glycine betaine ABC transporter substrate-binding protein [Desulfobacterales bacterium]|nr:glycine betaine ABC transporter substrate-binding protein [Desulfobacterales bacterium]MBS3754370.1 glycine betaine ABC transporter substrate-binding protein [Desulfobacterales bacterium]